MKVGRLVPPRSVDLEEVTDPTPGPGELVVDLAACGVCGTDLEKLRGNYQSKGILGHEPVGVVSAVGPGTTAYSIGQRVFVHHHVPCYHCPVCDQGAYTFCPEYAKSNIDPGGFADRFRVPRANVERQAVLPLSPSVSWDVGTLLEPAACAMTALRRVGFRRGQSVFVVGLGPVGILYARLVQALGASWVGGAEPAPFRRSVGERHGVVTFDARDSEAVERSVRSATGGAGVDISVVAAGAPAATALAERCVRRGGVLNLFGLPAPGSQLVQDLQTLYLSGVAVVPTYATTETDVADVHRLVTDRRLTVDDLVTHRFPLAQIAEAFSMAERPNEAVKVVVTGPAYR